MNYTQYLLHFLVYPYIFLVNNKNNTYTINKHLYINSIQSGHAKRYQKLF